MKGRELPTHLAPQLSLRGPNSLFSECFLVRKIVMFTFDLDLVT